MRNSLAISIFKKNTFLLLSVLLLFSIISYGQNQKLADSLERKYRLGNFEEKDRLFLLEKLAKHHTSPGKQLAYSIELINLAQEFDSTHYIWTGFMHKGNALRNKGDHLKALDSHFEAEKIAREEKSDLMLGQSYITLADVYSVMGNHDNAKNYYTKAIDLLQKTNDSVSLATVLLNAGDDFLNNNNFDMALDYFEKSGRIFKKLNDHTGIAYNLGNVGIVYSEQGKDDLAEENINEAIRILEELKLYSPISVYLTYMADIYLRKNNINRAISYALKSLDLAKKYNLKKEISDANLKLSELYEQKGNELTSLNYYKDHIIYKDSVKNIQAMQERQDFEMQKKNDEILVFQQEAVITDMKVKRQRNMNIVFSVAAVLIFLLAISYYRRYRFSKKTNLIIEEEKNRSDRLLLNILPKETALELKQSGKVKAQKFDSVSVLFTDFVGFTRYAEKYSPEELVESVDYYFSMFDDIIKKHNLEKIKTIGDSYMCAGGLHDHKKDHAKKILHAACDIINCVNNEKKSNGKNKINFEIRIGINTGSVVAGVVGTNKFSYDIWGDTVNIASRMESASETGRINVSEVTYQLVKDTFDCEYRGMIEGKDKRKMKMYFVSGLKT